MSILLKPKIFKVIFPMPVPTIYAPLQKVVSPKMIMLKPRLIHFPMQSMKAQPSKDYVSAVPYTNSETPGRKGTNLNVP